MPFHLLWITDEKMSGKRFIHAQKTQQLAIQAVWVCPILWSSRQCGKMRKTHRERSGRNQLRKVRKKSWNLVVSGLLWQRVKDSNPHIQSQSLLCYLYTNPLYSFVRVARTGIIIPENKNLSRFFFEKNNICRFQPFSGHFLRKTPAPRASSEADLVIPQVRSGAESAFSFNFICHQRPASLFVPPWFCAFMYGRDMDLNSDTTAWMASCCVFCVRVNRLPDVFQQWSGAGKAASQICAASVRFFLYGYLPAAVV